MAIDMPAPPSAAPQPVETPPRRSRLPRRRLGLAIAAVALLGGLGFGWHVYQDAGAHVETENAAVAGHLHPVSVRVMGTVAAVRIEDNQPIKAGQVLFELDDRDARIRVAQAEAALAQARGQATVAALGHHVSERTAEGQGAQAAGSAGAARASVETAQSAVALATSGVPAAEAQLAQAEAARSQADSDVRRLQALYAEGGVSPQQMQAAETALKTADAHVRQAREAVAQSRLRLTQAREDVRRAQAQAASAQGGLTLASAAAMQAEVSAEQATVARAGVAQAEAALADARQQLAYTRVVAPCDGRIAKRNVEVGQRVQPGQALVALIEPKIWVVANFKETQLADMRAGLPVEIALDAFPNRPLKGRVESFSPAAGSQLALLPPDNATGNFTKIVQRVPVKIAFEPASLQGLADRVVPGMSAAVRVSLR